MATPVHTAEVAEKPTCPAGRDENANAKNGLTFDPSPNMAKRRPKREPGLFVHISFSLKRWVCLGWLEKKIFFLKK